MTCPKCGKGFLTTNKGLVRDGWSHDYIMQFKDFCSNIKCDYNERKTG